MVADRTDLGKDMAGQDYRPALSQLCDKLPYPGYLTGVKADRRLVKDNKLRFTEHCLSDADPLPVAL